MDTVQTILDSPLGKEIIDGSQGAAKTPLTIAAYEGDAALVELLISNGADVNKPPASRSGGGAPPLHFAVARGSKADVDVMRRIMEGGGGREFCEVDKTDDSNSTALHKVMTTAKKGEYMDRKTDNPSSQ